MSKTRYRKYAQFPPVIVSVLREEKKFLNGEKFFSIAITEEKRKHAKQEYALNNKAAAAEKMRMMTVLLCHQTLFVALSAKIAIVTSMTATEKPFPITVTNRS